MVPPVQPLQIYIMRRGGPHRVYAIGIINEERDQIPQEQGEGAGYACIKPAGILLYELLLRDGAPPDPDDLVRFGHVENIEPRLYTGIPERDRKAELQAGYGVHMVVEFRAEITGHDGIVCLVIPDLLRVVPVNAGKIPAVDIELEEETGKNDTRDGN